jgi:hypothetical protein
MKYAALIAALALAACSPSPKSAETPAAPVAPAAAPTPVEPPTTAANPVPNPAEDACNKAAYAAIVGKPEKDPSVPPAGPNVRRIHPGDQVTLDFRAERLNIDIDARGVITGLRCG